VTVENSAGIKGLPGPRIWGPWVAGFSLLALDGWVFAASRLQRYYNTVSLFFSLLFTANATLTSPGDFGKRLLGDSTHCRQPTFCL
jgi:hypothetical protein